MKKKLLPYILGCSLAAFLPFAAHAEDTSGTYFHTGHDIETSGSTVDYADWNANTSSQSRPDVANSDGHNEFTEYNSSVNETTGTQNKRSMTFGTPSISGGAVNWTASTLGNTRNTTAATQTAYPVTPMNEKQGYRATAHTLAQDLAYAAQADPDDNLFSTHDNDTDNETDLETSISEYTMTIPAKTVLPMGAMHWRIGNVKINGKYFVRPDKIDVVVTHQNFRHTDYDPQMDDGEKVKHEIHFTISDRRYSYASIENADRYFFQNGTGAQTSFPYAYTEYNYTNYRDGLVSDINETHQVWLIADEEQWIGKTPGKYTGSITFNAEVTQDDIETDPNMYTNTYPGEGHETQP